MHVVIIITLKLSGAVEGESGECRYPKYFVGNVPPNNIRTRGNGDTVTFHQIGLQRNVITKAFFSV